MSYNRKNNVETSVRRDKGASISVIQSGENVGVVQADDNLINSFNEYAKEQIKTSQKV